MSQPPDVNSRATNQTLSLVDQLPENDAKIKFLRVMTDFSVEQLQILAEAWSKVQREDPEYTAQGKKVLEKVHVEYNILAQEKGQEERSFRSIGTKVNRIKLWFRFLTLYDLEQRNLHCNLDYYDLDKNIKKTLIKKSVLSGLYEVPRESLPLFEELVKQFVDQPVAAERKLRKLKEMKESGLEPVKIKKQKVFETLERGNEELVGPVEAGDKVDTRYCELMLKKQSDYILDRLETVIQKSVLEVLHSLIGPNTGKEDE